MNPFILGLPKCELHVHVEGTLEPELRFTLAKRNDVALPFGSPDEVRASYTFDSLSTFLVAYYSGVEVLRTERDFYDLAAAYLARAAEQNVRYAEIFFDPQAHTGRGVTFATVVEGLSRALEEAERDLGVRARLIMCFLRDQPAGWAMATLLESLPYRDRIVGVGLDSDERGNPPEKFAAVFARARDEGYRLTLHCDVDQPRSISSIRTALRDIGVDRIDHGSNIVEDDTLVDEIVSRGIGLTSCPVSNRFAGDMKAEEIHQLLDRGVKVTVSSDDPAYFGAYVAENLEALQDATRLTDLELVKLENNAFTIAWLADGLKKKYLEELAVYATR